MIIYKTTNMKKRWNNPEERKKQSNRIKLSWEKRHAH